MRHVWQIGAGDYGRDYAPLFIAHDLMFLGPGRYGSYSQERYLRLTGETTESSMKLGMVAAFASEIQAGDLVLLRRGYHVTAIGVVAEEGYLHDPTFDDVYGWDLEHTRRVMWQEHLSVELKALQLEKGLFASRKQIPTFTRVKDLKILGPLEHLLTKCRTRALKPRPEPVPEPLTLEELGQALFARGLANSAVDQVQKAIERQRRLQRWYREFGAASARPDEHEVVAHMVLPLLLALGWSEQLLAVEWHKVDLAGFWGTPTTAQNCVLVCEAKRMDQGLQDVLQQAERYVKDLHLEECNKILLTQGGRFYLYRRAPNRSWQTEPSGYFNVERIRTNHIAPANTNAVDTLMALTPAGVHRS